ncbi:putative capsid assembly protein [Azorhizobium caulinodans ORS 571]|uniref:Putative capsid assembly protein n=1 Tax=Azorhizobium caulinodans (strain ATCC 43989 / DSM 5975 / JCM 20966 / LMG 6465 / NBRC 14845 / NCIMB 13405 / ORS 571) TaxID=438753 RepID=A8IF77_AZOC5|nr:phage capsid assembly protein [Azorhizobium caulinodans]BAF89585.1 putative capsid assembly protein [Azorhizobium caulinodans ORS 571]
MTATVQMPAEVAGPNPPEAANTPAPVTGQETSTTPAIPEGFPDKFVKDGKPDYEALAKSYVELEGRFSQQQQAPAAPSSETVEQQLQAKGLNFEDFTAEYRQNGKLSAESYAKLEQAGWGRQVVNDFIRAQEILAEQDVNSAYSAVGGEAEFRKIQSWARSNLSPAELSAFNDMVQKASSDALPFVVMGLQARYVQANGREPQLINGHASGPSVEGFASRYEMLQAMKDPRYSKDEAYRDQVAKRLAVSNFF